jgi:tryptophan-rich sensory protein
MKLQSKLQSELCYADMKSILFCSIFSLIAGMLTGIFGGSGEFYKNLPIPLWILGKGGFIVLWSLFYILLGACVGWILGGKSYYSSCTVRSALFFFCLLFLTNLLWYPIFFGLCAPLFAFLILVIHLLISIYTTAILLKTFLLPSIILIVYDGWLLYCLLANFCIIMLN